MALNTVRKVGASLLPRRADLFQGLRRQHTSSPPENNEQLRKVLLKELSRIELDRQVVLGSWERLSFVRGKPPITLPNQQSRLKEFLIWAAPKTPKEAWQFVLHLTAGTYVIVLATPEQLKQGFLDNCKAWFSEADNFIHSPPPSKE